MATTKTTPLLELLAQRWQEFVSALPDPAEHTPVKRPTFSPAGLAAAREAARLHAEAHNSDPFAYGRALRRIRSGEWLTSDVRADALSRTAARKGEGVTFPISLAT